MFMSMARPPVRRFEYRDPCRMTRRSAGAGGSIAGQGNASGCIVIGVSFFTGYQKTVPQP